MTGIAAANNITIATATSRSRLASDL